MIKSKFDRVETFALSNQKLNCFIVAVNQYTMTSIGLLLCGVLALNIMEPKYRSAVFVFLVLSLAVFVNHDSDTL